MVTVLIYAALPTLAFWLLARFTDLLCREPRLRRRSVPPPRVDLARLQSDLRRLSNQYRSTESSNQPMTAVRLRALSMAYDDTLCRCCEVLGVPVPERPMRALVRLETEAALAGRGLRW